ncbi:aminotransferase class I/II-fold pyridoxal phosphate-dependent enzyme [bacterium]|nr:aminotransferase class I/II-fold pyridoxal phosphate-dependent enzyme [bacterium]
MTSLPPGDRLTPATLATDENRLSALFGEVDDLLPLWIAEPYVDLAPAIVEAMRSRAGTGWYGYETRPGEVIDAFWSWASDRHGWTGSDLITTVSPSVGTTIGVLVDRLTSPGDGVILQPPVFTDFKPLVVGADREVVKNPLVITGGRYEMDLADLEARAADPANRLMILCNPHNPVGRVWSLDELVAVAEICARHDVFVIADEIHADLALAPHAWVPFASASEGTGVSWAAIHGPIKTFGIAGLCDTLMISDDEDVSAAFRDASSRFHLTRNNVFGIAAFTAGYADGAGWLDELLTLIAGNAALLRDGLPDGIELIEPEGTYLAWLDFRALGMDVPELAEWLATSARLALSPGHWFGREGAGFARMTIAAPTDRIVTAIDRLSDAVR